MPNKPVPKIRLFQFRKPIKYSSARSRFANLDAFQAGAQLNDEWPVVEKLPIDGREDLEAKFKSGVNRTDIPRMWGHPSVDRKLGNKTMSLANEIQTWRRKKGEPL